MTPTTITADSDLYTATVAAIYADTVDVAALEAASGLGLTVPAVLGYVAGRECCPLYKNRAEAWNLLNGRKHGTWASFGEAYDTAYATGRAMRQLATK